MSVGMILIVEIFFFLFFLYLLVVWILTWFWFPHLRITVGELPRDLKKLVDNYSSEKPDDKEFLKKVMNLIKNRYEFGHFYMYLFPARWFEKDVGKIWNDRKAQMCTITDYLFESILIASGRFEKDQLKRVTIFTNFSMHQYTQVRTKDGQRIICDPWAYGMGSPFNKKPSYFV